jgi:hypothetical protein
MIVVRTVDDGQQVPAVGRRSWGAKFVAPVVLLVAGLVGFASTRALAPDPNQALLKDLPVIEHLEVYRQVGSVDFLRKLRESGLFTQKESSDAP